jgi:alkylation response protein AidB-like acyl-CoA dehydrogenase
MLALAALEHAGSREQLERHVPAILSGERVATLAFSEPGGSWEPEHVEARSELSNGGVVLSGNKTHVPAGASADLVIVPCLDPDGSIALFAVELPAERLAVHREVCVDRTRPTARLSLDRVPVPHEARLEGDGLAALRAAFCRGYVLLASEMVGAAEAVLGLTRDYAIERRQFGRAIGSFQAVKHPIVDMMIGIELSRNLALGAAAAFDQDPARFEQSARMAKAMAGQSFGFAVEKGVQLHGGFGFTWDCDVQLYFKRALWSRGTLGDGAHHRRHLARMLLDQPG